jgi:hypothetical protein
MWSLASPPDNLCITAPRAERDLLILVPSFTLSAVAFYLSYLSDPARSTNDILLLEIYLVSVFID